MDFVAVNRRGHGDDVDITPRHLLGPVRELQVLRFRNFRGIHFPRGIFPRCEFPDTFRLRIQSDGWIMLAEFDRQRQPHIAETHDSNPCILDIEHIDSL